MGEKKLEVLSVLVNNNYGVLTRISSLFGRRGYNIDSLTVSNTDDPAISRITITVQGDPHEVEQIVAQTLKLEEVREINVLKPLHSVMREIVLVKVRANAQNRSQIREVAEIYKASVVDLSPTSMIIELTGKPTKINAFIRVMEEFDIVEMCRTGITAMPRNNVEEIIRG
ncbi:MAG: acetolactate synthase small subunit [Eubacteriales bacterium]|nr:acetolactate synthase small subunit [Eubacteriales bacterium]